MDTLQFTNNGRFLMLALDHRDSFKKILNPQNSDLVSNEEIILVKKAIIESVSDQFSGILIDPKYGLSAFSRLSRDSAKPYLLSIEKSGYRDESGEKITELEYTVDKLKELGASGIKLLVYFNPNTNTHLIQLETIKKVFQECQIKELPFFLEIVTYHTDNTIVEKGNLVLTSLKRILGFGIRPDVFKLEFPGDEKSCDEITSLLGRIPWILLTRGENFEAFKMQLDTAILHGASGFLAGRALWQEVGNYKNQEERKEFLKNIVAKRFQEISSIVMKKSFIA